MPPMWLNVSHSFLCQVSHTWGAMWHPLNSSCVIRHPRLEKREIPTTSESNEIRRGYQTSQDDFNGEVRFVIRDLENFLIFTKITILLLFETIGFSRGFTDGTHKKPPFLKPVWKDFLYFFTSVKKLGMRIWSDTKSIVPWVFIIIKIKGLMIKILRKSFMGKRILIPILFS